jgi:hypothetical protein
VTAPVSGQTYVVRRCSLRYFDGDGARFRSDDTADGVVVVQLDRQTFIDLGIPGFIEIRATGVASLEAPAINLGPPRQRVSLD